MCLSSAIVVFLLNCQRLVEAVEPLLRIARAAVEFAESIQLRADNRGSIGRPRLREVLLMLIRAWLLALL